MEAPKALRPPSNWQDFEKLCKKLWGEIWECDEIQLNGRSGQAQSGVDVYGTPKGGTDYYGIQCKGRSAYVHSQFTEKEILAEIEEAKTFEPPLKKLYLATTAPNDAKTQVFVRRKNQEHIEQGLFEVYIFGWESIVDLIDENEQTHDWYVNSQNFKTKKGISVTFEDGSQELEVEVPFSKPITTYCIKKPAVNSIIDTLAVTNMSNVFRSMNPPDRINKSYFRFRVRIRNTGTLPIEKYKLKLDFDGKLRDLTREDVDIKGRLEVLSVYRITSTTSSTSVDRAAKTGLYSGALHTLVGDDFVETGEIKIKPIHENSVIKINWTLLSKNFKDEGVLTLNFKPRLIRKSRYELVQTLEEERTVTEKIEDYYEDVSRESST